MTTPVVLRLEAEEELLAAVRWYDAQKPGLGDRFADAIEATVDRIANNPSVFPPVYGETRRAVVRQFPYGVYFRIHERSVVILAVMHGHRHPHRWQSRD